MLCLQPVYKTHRTENFVISAIGIAWSRSTQYNLPVISEKVLKWVHIRYDMFFPVKLKSSHNAHGFQQRAGRHVALIWQTFIVLRMSERSLAIASLPIGDWVQPFIFLNFFKIFIFKKENQTKTTLVKKARRKQL